MTLKFKLAVLLMRILPYWVIRDTCDDIKTWRKSYTFFGVFKQITKELLTDVIDEIRSESNIIPRLFMYLIATIFVTIIITIYVIPMIVLIKFLINTYNDNFPESLI